MCGPKVTVPPPPPPTAQETALQQKQVEALDLYMNQAKDQATQNTEMNNILKLSSGLYTPTFDANGNLTGTTLDQGAYKSFQDNAAKNNEINSLQLDRYEKALKGELPISEGTKLAEDQAYNQMKEHLTSRGSSVTGTGWADATGSDSASIENLNRLRTANLIANQNEQFGAIGQGSPAAGSYSIGALSGASQFGPGAVAPMYAQVPSLASSAAAPLYNNRMLDYNASVTNAQLASQRQAGIYGMVGQGIGAATTLPFLLSSRDFKKDIREITPEEEDQALFDLKSPKTYRYKYKWEDEKSPDTTGFMAEEAPPTMRRGRMIDMRENISLLTSAVRSLDRKVDSLERKAA